MTKFKAGDYITFHGKTTLGAKVENIEVARVNALVSLEHRRYKVEVIRGRGTAGEYGGGWRTGPRVNQPGELKPGVVFTISEQSAHLIDYKPQKEKQPQTSVGLPPLTFPEDNLLTNILAMTK